MEVGYLLAGWGWTYSQMNDAWVELEQLGFDLCYLGDDFFPHPQMDANVFDPWSILPAMAATTTTMRMGSLVSPAGRRHPGLFAKMTTAVDHVSNGRLIVGMGAGNAPEQQATVHQPYLAAGPRTQMLREELTVLHSLWTQSRTTFDGEHFRTSDAICEPKGARSPHPEVLIALKNIKLMAPLAGQFANRTNLLGNDDNDVRRLSDAVRTEAARHGRDGEAIVMGRLFQVLLTDDVVASDDVALVLTQRAHDIGVEPEELIAYHHHVPSYVGPPQGAAQAILDRTHALGIQEVVLNIDTVGMLDYDRTVEGIRVFAAEILRDVQAA
jgi:alkanesulfonate monooxygenase SsuD/methylene tetrahydromethanopterin reductase-like flavin-dependent oxidoreductase (luciferase family)